MKIGNRIRMSTNSTDLAPDDSDRHILQASECDLESRQALEQALQDPAARIPPQFEDYFYKFQTIHRSEEHTSELQSRPHHVCRLLLEKKNDGAVDGADDAALPQP